MTVKTIFESCTPRADVLKGTVTEADFAADLAQVIVGEGNDDYVNPERFFANTYPTKGLKNLLENVCRRLTGAGGEAASIFRLDTSYGGGKSHALIALCHAARSGPELPGIAEFVDPALIPSSSVRIAAFDGENADPANGRRMAEGHVAYTPWGEIAWALAGKEGYERVRTSDEKRVAPGAETLRELFGGEPTLILLDELSVYLRKVNRLGHSIDQLTAFLTSLFKAVEVTPNAVLVYTLAIGKDGRATDAYRGENQAIADAMAEAESVSARKSTLLNPTEEDETIKVLCRRLFASTNEAAADAAANAYRELWSTHRDRLPESANRPEASEAFRASYPLHPEVLETLTAKMATLGNFQRVRGMLRLLSRTVAHLWKEKPADATAIHLHHIDLGHKAIRQEIVTRLEQSAFLPAISNDVSAGSGGKQSLAEELDDKHHKNLPPYTSYIARTIFLHTLAFNEPLKGVADDQLRYSVLGPAADIAFIDDALKRFVVDSAYLDDRPGVLKRFLAEANLNQIIRRTEEHLDPGGVRTELKDQIREIFKGATFDTVLFPGGPYDVSDDVGNNCPKLVVVGYEALTVGGLIESVPNLIDRIYKTRGVEGAAVRKRRNNLVFVVADEEQKENMTSKTRRRLALREVKKPEQLLQLAQHQQNKVLEMEAQSRQELALAIQQCYRHLLYPSTNRIGSSKTDLAHSAINVDSASERPGAGQLQVVRALRDLKKLRLSGDEPNSPAYVRDSTPLREGMLSTASLRDEFRRDPALPILVGDDTFVRGVEMGIRRGEYVYRRGDLVCGRDDPEVEIKIDDESMILTTAHAKKLGVWPPQTETADPPGPGGGDPPGPGGGRGPGGGDPPRPDDEDGVVQFTAEGILREALVQIWERAREKNVDAIAEMTVCMYEFREAFKLFGTISSVSKAERTVTMTGGYETQDGGTFDLEFSGPVNDARPVREFLELQMRDAESANLKTSFRLKFEDGLLMDGGAADKLAERLSRFSSGVASVSATVKV